ncbi:MAG: dephospho-CoA kinase [Bacillota bacterium]|nr:MAG: dephospho-CoA kinase [Bacillota bacterium]
MIIIGLTGGIASGKSTVSRVLRELGAPVIDSDLVAKEVVRPGTEAWRELVEAFGDDILLEDRTIDRRKLGDRVFGDPGAVARLNAITHPRIIGEIRERLRKFAEADPKERPPAVVVDAPVLIEAGMVDMVDEVWLVVVDQKTQIQRLMARDHFGVEQALNRINAQIPLEKKKKYADVIIDNTGPVRETRARVRRLWDRIVREAG